MRKVFIAIAVAFGLLCAQNAEAAFKLRITAAVDGTFGNGDDISFTWTDQVLLPPPPDMNPVPGLLSTGPGFVVGVFIVSADGVSKPFGVNNASSANLHLHALTVTSAIGGLIRIELTDTDYAIAPAGGTAFMISGIGGTASPGNIVMTAQQKIQLGAGAGTEFAPAPTFVLTNAPPPLTGAFSSTVTGTFAYAGGPFSITEFVELSMGAGAIISFDYDTQVLTPAPSGLVLAITGGLSFVGFRLRRKQVVA